MLVKFACLQVDSKCTKARSACLLSYVQFMHAHAQSDDLLPLPTCMQVDGATAVSGTGDLSYEAGGLTMIGTLLNSGGITQCKVRPVAQLAGRLLFRVLRLDVSRTACRSCGSWLEGGAHAAH